MVSRRRQRAASAANPKAHAQSSRPPPPEAHARLNQSAPSAKAGRLGCEPAGMLCQHGGSAAGTWRRTPPMYTGRCIAICHAARLKTRQAPSHAGWRIFVVYIFPRKHDLNRKKLDLGTRHPRPTFAPSPRREVRPRRVIKRALKPRLQCSQRAMWSLQLLKLTPPPGRATMPLLASMMVQGLIRPCAPLKPSIYAAWRHGKRSNAPI